MLDPRAVRRIDFVESAQGIFWRMDLDFTFGRWIGMHPQF